MSHLLFIFDVILGGNCDQASSYNPIVSMFKRRSGPIHSCLCNACFVCLFYLFHG